MSLLRRGDPFRLQLPAGLLSVNPAWSSCVDTMKQAPTFFPVKKPLKFLSPAAALSPAQTKDAKHIDPSSIATPISQASQPLPSKTAPPSESNTNSGLSNEPSNENRQPVENDDPEEHEPSTGTVPSTEDSPPLVNSAPSKDSTAAGNHAPAEDDQLVGNSPQTSKDFPHPNNIDVDPPENSLPADQQPSYVPAGTIKSGNEPARIEAASNQNTQIDGHTIQAATSAKGILVDGQYINRGGESITLSGTPIALQSNGDLVIGTSTVQNLLSSLPTASTTVFTVGSQAVTISSSSLIAGSITLRPNDPSVTVDGTVVSLGQSALQIGTDSIPLGSNAQPLPTAANFVAGQPVQLFPNRIVIAGKTLTANAPAITLAGTPVSLGGNGLIVGTSTVPLTPLPPTSIITIAGQTYAISENANGVSSAGKTLQLGQPAIAISGTPISLDSSELIIDGTSTIPLQSIVGASTLSTGIGGLIFAGLNRGPGLSPTLTGLVTSNQTQNITGADGGLEAFLGRGVRVEAPVYYLVLTTLIMLFT